MAKCLGETSCHTEKVSSNKGGKVVGKCLCSVLQLNGVRGAVPKMVDGYEVNQTLNPLTTSPRTRTLNLMFTQAYVDIFFGRT